MSIEYSESLEEAAQIARAALPLANKFALPANPVNYAVLYEYVAGHNPKLNAALDHLCEDTDGLSDLQAHSLYNNFVNDTDEQALKDVRLALSNIVDSTRGSLDRVNQKSQMYHENLSVAAKQLTSDNSKDVVDVVAELIDETVRMQEASRGLQEELSQTNKDLSSLRSEFKRVREESLIDPLTGIQNRRAFDIAIVDAHAHTRVSNDAFSLLMVDIDNFKKINDTYGHMVGDGVLKQISKAIHDSIRGGDVLARFGGEEFVVLLPNTTMEGAETVADHICNKVRNQLMRQEQVGKDVGRVTVSVGVAMLTGDESTEDLLARADTALYRAKESGRNRVCIHSVS